MLERTINLPQMVFFGLGTVVGAGIYVLIGKVAGISGAYTTHTFILAGLLAFFTACSYAELASRFPKSAGAALYVQQAFNQPKLSTIVGWLIILTGIVSAATMANGFVGYIHVFVNMPEVMLISLFTVSLTLLCIIGIKESTWFICLVTLLEVGGLLYVIALGPLQGQMIQFKPLLVVPDWRSLGAIFSASFLAFYAFIGFEDMVNVAEELENPERNLPIAILLTLTVSLILYVMIALVAISFLSLDELVSSEAPMAAIVSRLTGNSAVISGISLIAILNGAIVQMIMASRVMYGMAHQKLAPSWLAITHPKTKTPIYASLITALLVFCFAIFLPLIILAKLTSFVIIIIFLLVNISLLKIKQTDRIGASYFETPRVIPMIGATFCVVLLLSSLYNVVAST